MKRFISLLMVALGAWTASCAVNSHTLTVTNFPLAGAGTNVTPNSITRAWTNVTTGTTIGTNLSSLAGVASNLFNAYGAFPQSGVTVTWLTSTQLVFKGLDLTLSAEGNWCTIVTNSSTTTNLTAIMGPPSSISTLTNRTNNANWIVEFASEYANAKKFATNAYSLQDFVSAGLSYGGGTQHITGPKLLGRFQGTNEGFITGGAYRNGAFTNGLLHATNGLVSDTTFLRPKLTNGVNYGNPFSSSGSGSGSEQFGSSSVAAGAQSQSYGFACTTYGTLGLAYGSDIANYADGAAVFGGTTTVETNADGAVYVGYNGNVQSGFTLGLGNNITLSNEFSGVINILDESVASRRSGELYLNATVLYSRGRLEVGSVTNLTVVANSSNHLGGDLSFSSQAITTLANGTNVLASSTNVVISLDGTLTADSYLAGIQGGRARKWHKLPNTTSYYIQLLPESGLAPSATDRFATSLSRTPSIPPGGHAWVSHNGSRWQVENVYPESSELVVSVSVTADNWALSTTNVTYYRITSNSGTATDRTLVLSSGQATGQELVLEAVSTSNAWELVDDASVTGGGSLRLNGAFSSTQYDMLTLKWNGTDWLEKSRSGN